MSSEPEANENSSLPEERHVPTPAELAAAEIVKDAGIAAVERYASAAMGVMDRASVIADKAATNVLFIVAISLIVFAFVFKLNAVGLRIGELTEAEFGVVLLLAAVLLAGGAAMRFYASRAQFQLNADLIRYEAALSRKAMDQLGAQFQHSAKVVDDVAAAIKEARGEDWFKP